MKKKFFLCSIISFILLNAEAQEIIGTSGDYFENAQASLSWTIGEPVTETFSDLTTILTQGFQQNCLITVSIFELEGVDIFINIYPNPTPDVVVLYTDKYDDISYMLYDYNGKLISQSELISEKTGISFTHLVSAVYFLKIVKSNKLIKTFQIIKQ